MLQSTLISEIAAKLFCQLDILQACERSATHLTADLNSTLTARIHAQGERNHCDCNIEKSHIFLVLLSNCL
jgi:hypothetical protein